MRNKKIEGYWYSEYEPNYPMPKPNVLSDDEAKEIYEFIKKKEEGARINRYKGWSTSRITGEHLGSTEFETDEWIWPVDFAPHYVMKHKVKPTDEFLKYIGYGG
jgi:hypothetical protein